ncbi:class I SAM-dependent methyltransferase [Sedimenticola hydrogenitrophicus]|uniref:class I SAM-dependent methyltransferase n=1 Tax=Sedimenticola hydrogenitrophicus TaxID=2967975 RepID=UPI0023B1B07C|nr:class I SAM-dependent methyltransferase [Sedimenticola hydrogenitrophicus]
MSEPEFDQYAENYDRLLNASIPDSLNEGGYFAEYKVALMAAWLKDSQPKRILDFGCGSGRSLPYLVQYFPSAELWGYDVSPGSLKFAGRRAPQARLFSDWNEIGTIQFDAIIAANVFHHIPLPQRKFAFQQCYHTLSEQGQFFLFEHNPYNPATRWIFERCPFDADAEMLSLQMAMQLSQQAGFTIKQHGYTMFFPRPFAFLRRLEPYLKLLPLGAQYYVQLAR